MNNEDWEYLYDIAGATFSKGKFIQGLTKDDFKQMCALEAMENIEHLQDPETKKTRISNIVYYMKQKNIAGKHNLEKNTCKAWSKVRHETRLHEELIEEHYLADWTTVEKLETIFHNRDLKKKLNELLKPLEIKIIDAILQGMNYSEIADQYGRTRDAISKRVQVINKKLEGLVL